MLVPLFTTDKAPMLSVIILFVKVVTASAVVIAEVSSKNLKYSKSLNVVTVLSTVTTAVLVVSS